MSSEFVVTKSYQSDYRSPARYIWSHVWRQKLVLFVQLLGAFSNAALASAVPYFTGLVYDRLVNPDPDTMAFVWQIVLLILLSQGARAVLQLMRNFGSEVFAQRIERDVRDELYASLLGKSMTFHDRQPVGDIMARVTNDVREMNLMMNPGFNLVIGSSFFLLIPLMVIPLIRLELLLVPLLFVILYVWTQYHYVRTLHPVAQRVRQSFSKVNSRLAEALEGLQVVKGAARERQESAYFGSLVDEWAQHYIRQSEIEARYLAYLWLGIAFGAGFLHCVLLFQQGLISGGDIVNYMGQIALFGFPVFSSLFALSRIASGIASAQRILTIINTETDLDRNEQGYSGKLRGDITFANVSFGYDAANLVLKNVSFSVQAGQTLAIVGQTGAGKTTLTKLLNRTYDVTAGRVLVDGIDVRDWNLEALRSQISVIEQDIFLFSRTITQNIAFGVESYRQEDVEEAAKKAQAHDFIMSFPDGYNTMVGQRGMTLSGGQKQRLAIARAFESDPPILVLDDSTSAIDSATEDRIQKAIWTAAKGRTTLLITHRLSQIRWADRIVVLKQGEVVAQGTHDQLLQTSEVYRRIFARYEDPVRSEG